MKPFLHIRRYPYEEPEELQLLVSASNGGTSGQLEIYSTPEELRNWADRLEVFPRHQSDVFLVELGSERPEDRYSCYFRFRAFTTDGSGHCALHFRFCNNSPLPNRAISEFCIIVEAAQINRLGKLLRGFADLRHELLAWGLDHAKLYEREREFNNG